MFNSDKDKGKKDRSGKKISFLNIMVIFYVIYGNFGGFSFFVSNGIEN